MTRSSMTNAIPIASTLALALILTGPAEGAGRVLRVGPAANFATPSAAALAARDDDIVEIAAADYRGDVAVWTASRLRIVGLGARPHISGDGRNALGKGIWVVRGDDTVIENVEISGARVPERNGAAIRLEGRNLVLRDAYLHDNENGLLAGAKADSTVTIEHCEFARTGNGEGYTHNLYVGAVAKLTVDRSYLHHAVGGHQLKSRAAVSVVTNSRLADEADGRASYEADFPNGGNVTLVSNILQKGASAENTTLVSFGAEGLSGSGDHRLVAKGNTFVGQRPNGVRFLFVAPGVQSVELDDNVFAGPGVVPEGAAVRARNTAQPDLPSNTDRKPEGFR